MQITVNVLQWDIMYVYGPVRLYYNNKLAVPPDFNHTLLLLATKNTVYHSCKCNKQN